MNDTAAHAGSGSKDGLSKVSSPRQALAQPVNSPPQPGLPAASPPQPERRFFKSTRDDDHPSLQPVVRASTTHKPSMHNKKVISPLHCTQEESDAMYDRLFINNRAWVKKMNEQDPEFFLRLSLGQHPNYLLIGCSDSRVPPNQLTQTRPGEIFIHRNVANLVVNTDMNFMAVLQYAVEVLRVKHVIVMGHYECGGVKAALCKGHFGLINKWLRNIKDVIRLHRDELAALDEARRFRRLVELNVQEQVFNVIKTSIVQHAWREGHSLRVHGWVCDVKSGLITDLHVEQSDDWKSIESIYTLSFREEEQNQLLNLQTHKHIHMPLSAALEHRLQEYQQLEQSAEANAATSAVAEASSSAASAPSAAEPAKE